MSEHISTERMNEALDGLLSAAEIEPIERHLEACAPCRNEYARLSETIAAISALPKSAAVPQGVWEVVAERIGSADDRVAENDTPVYRLPTAAKGAKRISFSIPELAAAAIVVALMSAAIVWTMIGGGGIDGHVFAIFVIVLAAAEAAVALAIILQLFDKRSDVDVDRARTLRG